LTGTARDRNAGLVRRALVAGVVVIALLTGCAGATRQGAWYVDSEGAQLRGHVASSRTETGSWWFEWGRTPELGRQTAPTPIEFTAGQSHFVWHNLNRRDPDTTYYWRLCADDQDPEHPAPGCSDVGTFTTLPEPPGRELPVDGGWQVFYNARDGSLNAEGPWTFEGPAVLTVLDSYCASDRFRVFDNGVSIGRTPAVEDPPGCNPYVLTLQESLADPEHYSRGSFALGPGPHAIRIRVLAGDGNDLDSGGYLRADSLNP
jgi:hypothetical protein